MIRCETTGLVYTNAKPYLKAVHAWHPSIAHLGNTELICAFDLGEAAESLDYCTYIANSFDGGQSWQEPRRLFHEQTSRPTTHTARIMVRRDGTLMGFGARFYRDDPKEGLTNRTTLGFVPMELILLESKDKGLSWLGPTTIDSPLDGPAFEICHGLIELNDGRLLAPTQTWPAWDGRTPHGWKAIALVSADQGRSWPDYLSVFHDPLQGTIHFEQSIVQLADGRLLAVAWAYNSKTRETLPTPYAISRDGQTFSPPMPTGLTGETAKLLVLSDGRILCVYRRVDKPGLWAQLAYMDGRRWINLAEQPLWRMEPQQGQGSKNTSDHLSSLKLGYPSMVELPDGVILLVFWCEENGIHNIRWMRIIVDAGSQHRPHYNTRGALDGVASSSG